MKRLFVLVPSTLLVLFLLNSFVKKEKEADEKTTESLRTPLAKVPVAKVNILYKSTDGGQTWQDISQGLPEIEQPVNFSVGESDLHLHVKNVMYRSKSNLKTPIWEKENVPALQNKGRVMNVVESKGVLIATGTKGIMRSADNGEHWKWIISEGGVGIAVERIEGGFAAIAYNTKTKSRRIHISLDNGKTWKIISEGLAPSPSISSIKQMGKYLICGHPDGIFRSSDMGKTWNSVHPGVDKVENKGFKFLTIGNNEPKSVFKIYVSGDVLYTVAVSAGC